MDEKKIVILLETIKALDINFDCELREVVKNELAKELGLSVAPQ